MVIKMFNIDNALISLGKRIQEARQLRNITQDELAEACGVTAKHISAIERSTTSGSVVVLLKICNYLQITPNSLFADTFPTETENNIIPIQKHETFLKYSKLSKNNQKFIDNSICHIFDEQTRKK